jgi:hypothetical protein
MLLLVGQEVLMIPLLMEHPGDRVVPAAPGARPPFFRRILRGMRREAAVPAEPRPAGAATVLIADAEPVMRDRMLSEVRAESDARQQAVQDMRAEYIASGLREAEAAGELTQERMRALMAESAKLPAAPGYGQTCTANVLAAEQAGRAAS